MPTHRLEDSAPANLLYAALQWSELVWQYAEQLGPIILGDEQLSDGLTLIQRPIFVCGVHRSGTTLVQNLMDGHRQLCVLPSEGTFYTNQEQKLSRLPTDSWAQYLGAEWLRRMANPINQAPYFLLGMSDETSSPYVDFARYVLAWWDVLPHQAHTQWPHSAIILAYASVTNNLKAKHWVDKTPTNERFLNRIWGEFPEAKIVHVVREPIATLTSRKMMEPTITLRNALSYLKVSYQIATNEKIVNDSHFHLLRYEELCDDPDETLVDLAGFLQIENTDSLRKATTAGIAAHANSSFKKNVSSGSILKPSARIQLDLFTPADKKLISASIGEEAEILGYPMEKVKDLGKVYAQLTHALFS